MKHIIYLSMAFAMVLTSTVPVLAQDTSSITPPERTACMKFVHNIKHQDRDSVSKNTAVTDLQNSLYEKGYLQTKGTGYFGKLTMQAVKAYQKDNGIVPTGFVGEKTRGVLRSHFCGSGEDQANCKVYFDGCNTCTRNDINSQLACTKMACLTSKQKPYCKEYFSQPTPLDMPLNCKSWFDGCNTCSRGSEGAVAACTLMACPMMIRDTPPPLPYCKEYFDTNSYSPVINSISGPTSMMFNETGTWKINASIVGNSNLSYSISWGDEPLMYATTSHSIMQPKDIKTYQDSSFQHKYANAGTYTVSITVYAEKYGTSVTSTQTVVVQPQIYY